MCNNPACLNIAGPTDISLPGCQPDTSGVRLQLHEWLLPCGTLLLQGVSARALEAARPSMCGAGTAAGSSSRTELVQPQCQVNGLQAAAALRQRRCETLRGNKQVCRAAAVLGE
jgi:hypothetical protein